MFPERRTRSKRRSLNPTKAVFVYVAALFLVCFHQAGPLADWFDGLALKSGGFISETAFRLASGLRSAVVPRGPAQMNRAENRLLALAPSSLLGQVTEVPPLMTGQLSQVVRKLEPLPKINPGDAGAGSAPPPAFARLATPEFDVQSFPVTEDDGQPEVFNPAGVLLLGDSMMLEGLGPQLQRELKKHEGLDVNRDGRYGTGLTRLDAFDWLSYFDQVMAKYHPDLIIITLGANDAQDILNPEGPQKRIRVGGEQWNAIYAERVKLILGKAERRNVQVFWIGLPIIGREQLGKWYANINAITAEVCEGASNCRFWDSWLSVADGQGRYAAFIRNDEGKSVRIRAKDAIHLTEDGGRIMAGKFLADTADWADYDQGSSGEPAPHPAEEGQAPPPDAPLAENEQTPPPAAPPSENEQTPQPVAAPADAPLQPAEQAVPAPSAGDGDDDGRPAAGQFMATVAEHRFFSPARNKETVYFTAVPDGPGPYPVVVLLHGAWDGAGSWAEHLGREKLARLAAEHELFLVMPDGEPFGWYLDGREAAIESFLIKELIPRTLRDRRADSGRVGITGLSMGGHGALTLALKHPRIFQAAGSMSGVTDLAGHSGGRHKLDPELGLERALGPAGPDGRRWRRHSAYGLIESDPGAWGGRPLIISVGRDDRLTADENRAFHDLLTRLNIEHVYHEDDGGHDWDYWAGQLPVHLEFIGGKLREKKDREAGK